MIAEIIRQEAPTVYPVPLTENQVDVFLKRYRNKSDDEIYKLWQKKKKKHIATYRKRHGMDDYRPFGSKEPRLLFICQWFIDESNCYSISFDYSQETPLVIRGRAGSFSDACDRVIENIQSQYRRYGLTMLLTRLENRGMLQAYTKFEPEHDWDIWKSRMLNKYPVKQGVLKQLISAYRKGDGPAQNLKQLEELVHEKSNGS